MPKKHNFSLYPKKQKVKLTRAQTDLVSNSFNESTDEPICRFFVPSKRSKEEKRLQRNVKFLKSLNPSVKRRIRALDQLQSKACEIATEQQEEYVALRRKFTIRLYSEISEKSSKIIQGLYEPTDEEATWKGISANGAAVSDVLQTDDEDEDNQMEPSTIQKNNNKIVNIPGFWSCVLRKFANETPLKMHMVRQSDLPALRHLIDVKVNFLECPRVFDLAFEIEFHFEPNEFFEDEVLKRTYCYTCKPILRNSKVPLVIATKKFICKSTGQVINWKPNKNLCKKQILLQKRSNHGERRPIAREIKCDSFFKYFDPAEESTLHFYWGRFLINCVLTTSVSIYTGLNWKRWDSRLC